MLRKYVANTYSGEASRGTPRPFQGPSRFSQIYITKIYKKYTHNYTKNVSKYIQDISKISKIKQHAKRPPAQAKLVGMEQPRRLRFLASSDQN